MVPSASVGQPGRQAFGGQLAGVVFEQPDELAAAELKRQRMKVADVDDERVGMRGNAWILQRAQHGRGCGVHHPDRQPALGGRNARERLQAGHDLRHGIAPHGKGAEPPILPQAAGQVVHAELAVADAGRRRAMIEDGQRQGIGPQVSAERGERAPNRSVVEIPEFDVGVVAARRQLACRLSRDDFDPQLTLDPLQVIVEGTGGIGRCQHAQPGAAVRLDGPRDRAPAHDHARDQQRQPRGRRPFHLLADQQRRRRHHQLQTILRRPVTVEQQDILGAGADVDG